MEIEEFKDCRIGTEKGEEGKGRYEAFNSKVKRMQK